MTKYTVITRGGKSYPHLAKNLKQAYLDCEKLLIKEFQNVRIVEGWEEID